MKSIRSLIFILSITALGSISSQTVIEPAIGQQAPEIELIGPNGELVKLSALKGKMVLIDFWASWCKTCRVQNRTYTQTYEKFKDSSFIDGNGFEIFSVSLDSDKDQWKRAIQIDKLSWNYHCSDLKRWDSPVVDAYNFKYLPHNLIIDKEGLVIAKELYGQRLNSFLVSRIEK